MNVVNLCFFTEGNITGKVYEENVTISEELYRKIENNISQIKVFNTGDVISEEIDVQFCEEPDIADWYTGSKNDGYAFYTKLEEMCRSLGLDLETDNCKTRKYCESFDYCVKVTVTVRKSNVGKLKEFALECCK